MSKWKKWLSTALLGFLLLPLWGQEASDTTYTFRFVAEEDMFYIPWRGNDKELSRLESCVSRYRERILSGEIPVRVEGWCNSLDSEQANLRMAAVWRVGATPWTANRQTCGWQPSAPTG